MPAFIKNQPWVGKIGCIFLGAPVDLMSISFAEEIPDEHLQVLTEINNASIHQLDIILFVLGKADQAIMDRVFTELKLLRATNQGGWKANSQHLESNSHQLKFSFAPRHPLTEELLP